METKRFYRVANIINNQGLWYDMDGNFTGLIHSKFNFCTNHNLEMPYDENVIGYLSAADNLEDVSKWFTKDDIRRLEEYDYHLFEYISDDYKFYNGHWLISQKTSTIVKEIIV
ncbi:MAG: hypothetical protein E6767_19925 [Dysgonomonas sp.]|nr:hypothetical protein [Dysgonomonas sp.]